MRATSKFQLEPILNSRNVHQRPSARSGQSAATMSRLRREEVAAALRDVPSTMVPRSIRSIHFVSIFRSNPRVPFFHILDPSRFTSEVLPDI